jgi:hypothetical protein
MRYLVCILALLSLIACEAPEPSGPTVNISGNNNQANIPSGGTGNTQTTPAPVVVPPTVIVPDGAEPVEE